MLRTEKLRKRYGKRDVVKNLTIEVERGSVLGLLGPNGAGKTTSFYMITGMINPTEGSIFIDNNDITRMPMYRRARLGIGYLPQETSIFRNLTVKDNIRAMLEMLESDSKIVEEKTQYLLEKLKISHIAERKASNLSGGERRRAEIARALTSSPSFLLLDEPFTGIDPKVREDIQNIVRGLAKENIGVIITDHNVRETLEIIDTAHIIYEGDILISGTADELISNEEAKQLYLGEKFSI
ncbi:MAG: LPS export ABC transporter ATP-binding protein [candidate division WOR-3 bacterium]|nr:LPS export ABC transporter ATP-binding protein [candidate division WOR-3 bacterium]